MVETLEHFRVFIYGYDVMTFVDRKSVKQLLRKDRPSKLVRYREMVQSYQPKIIYVKDQRTLLTGIQDTLAG